MYHAKLYIQYSNDICRHYLFLELCMMHSYLLDVTWCTVHKINVTIKATTLSEQIISFFVIL